MKIEVKIDSEDIRERLEKNKSIIFEVPWEHNGISYPMRNWSDFGDVILGWWVMTAIQLLEDVDERRFMFMDGPYFIKARYYRESGLVELSPKGTEVVWKVQMFELLTKLVEALERVYEEFAQMGISPKNLDCIAKQSAILKKYLTNDRDRVNITGVPSQYLRNSLDNSDGIKTIAISPDGKTLVSGDCDKTIKIWDLATGELTRTLEGHNSTVSCVILSPDGQTLVSSSWDETVKIWDFPRGEVRHSCKIYEGEEFRIVNCLVISLDGQTLYTATRNGSTYYWDIKTGKKLGNLSINSLGSSRIAMSADSRILAENSIGILTVWELPEAKRRFEIETDRSTLSLAIAPDGETIYIGDYGGRIHLYDGHEGEELLNLESHSDLIKTLAVSRDGSLLASGDKQGTIKLWQLDSQTEICTLEGHTADITGLIFSPDSRTLISGSLDKTIKIWELLTEVVR